MEELKEDNINTVPIIPGYYDAGLVDAADQVPMEDLYRLHSGVGDNYPTEADLRKVSITEYVVRTGWGEIADQARITDRSRRKRQKALRRAQQIQAHGKHLHIFTTWELVRLGIWAGLICLVLSGALVGVWLQVLQAVGVQ